MRTIPTSARADLAAIHDGIDAETYRDDIWKRRDIAHTRSVQVSGAWPFIRVADQPAPSQIDVHRLPAKLRAKG